MADKPKNLKCRLFGHSWKGCKCGRCGEIRDEEHSWSGCTCITCGKTRDQDHDWVPEPWDSEKNKGIRWEWAMAHCVQICTACKKHNWVEHVFENVPGACFRKCRNCGYETPPRHAWDECKCLVCGATRDEQHSWTRNGCIQTCEVCGKRVMRDEYHEWTQRGCDEACVYCGAVKSKGKYHEWVLNGCEEKCSRCGETRENHDFRLVSKNVTYGKCSNVGLSDDYICTFCRTPNDCLHYPLKGTYKYRCARCGRTETEGYARYGEKR